MWNARLDEAQAGIKTAGRNTNNLRYDTALIVESEEELKSLFIQKAKIMASSSITSWKIRGKKWNQWQIFSSWALKTTADGDCSHEIKRCSLLGKKAMTNLDSLLKS